MRVRFEPSDRSLQVTKPPAIIKAGEGLFDGAISRFGHGLQRCFLLAILQELAAADTLTGPKLLLGIEEPELYQHPPQARHLANVLVELTTKNSQVIVSTHSPLFVTGLHFENVRLVRRRPVKYDTCVTLINVEKLTDALNASRGGNFDKPAATIAKINRLLQPSLNEMFFAPVIVFVEGLEDVAFLTSQLVITDRLKDFRRLGCHIVPTNGKDDLPQPIAIAKQLGIPCFVVFDSDANVEPKWLEMNKRHNAAILHVLGYTGDEPLPKATVWKDDSVMWHTDIGDAVAGDVGADVWSKMREEVKKKYSLHAKGDLSKNGILIGHVLAEAADAGHKFPTLEKLVTAIIKFASKATGKPENAQPVAVP
jgi:predicted ATP-dependent endonuclease of OLD family